LRALQIGNRWLVFRLTGVNAKGLASGRACTRRDGLERCVANMATVLKIAMGLHPSTVRIRCRPLEARSPYATR
jgi:hypothetical protein